MATDENPPAESVSVRNAERMKFFTDAVVAIAMTLLILPLVESVSEAAAQNLDTAEFLSEHWGQLFSFALSFVIIANFWVGHERLFSLVGTWHGPLMVLNIGWMFCIVFLPVITAMVGSMPTDNLQVVVYIGTMLVTSLCMAGMQVVVRRTPRLWASGTRPGVGGLAASLSLVILYAVSIAGGVLLPPGTKFFILFILMLTGPLQRLLAHLISRRDTALSS